MVTPKDFFHRLTKIKNYITNPHGNERQWKVDHAHFNWWGEDLNKFVCKWCVCPSRLTPPQVLKKANAAEKKGWTKNMVQARHNLGLTERDKTFAYKHINLMVKKLFKIAISTTSRTARLAVCESRIYNSILSAKKYEKKRPNKQGWMTEAAVFQYFPAVWGYLCYVELMSLLN